MSSGAATSPSWSGSSRAAPRGPARSPRRRSMRCASAWAWELPVGSGRYREASMNLAALELDLEVFTGPFDLLLTLVLREEVDLLELPLAEIVLAYLDHPHARGELDLETTTECIVLVAALLELKSRMMLTDEEQELLDIEPEQAAEELLARLFEAHRYPRAATTLGASPA